MRIPNLYYGSDKTVVSVACRTGQIPINQYLIQRAVVPWTGSPDTVHYSVDAWLQSLTILRVSFTRVLGKLKGYRIA